MSVILIRAGHTLNPRIQGVHDPNARSLTQSLNFYSRDSRIFPPNLQTRPMPSALFPQDIKGYLLSTVTRQLFKLLI